MTAEDLIAEINTEKPQIDSPEAQTPVETPENGQITNIQDTTPEPVTTGTEQDTSQQPAPEAVKGDLSDDLFYNRLSEWTGGNIKSKTDYEGLVRERDELREQATKGFEPKFKNEREKWAYQILSTANEDSLGAALRVGRALKYETEGKDKKETLFEAYLLDPNNADLTEQKALEYFNADYEQRFGDIEGNILKERELELAHRSAKESILKTQTDFKAVDDRPQQAAIAKDVEDKVSSVVKGFKELKIAVSDKESFNVAIDNPQELQNLQESILNPDQAYNELVSQFERENGFDYEGLRNEMYQRANYKKLISSAYTEGKKAGELNKVNQVRNASDPKKPSDLGQAAGNRTLTKEDKWAQALGV